MKKLLFAGAIALTTVLTTSVFADCSTKQTFCEAKCAATYLTDEAAELGCKSKCVAQRALCSTESGAKAAVDTGGKVVDKGVEAGKNAWDNTKSFFKGITE